MNDATRILILEDYTPDYELAQREISRSLKHCQFQRAQTRREYLKALQSFQPDIILSDYSLPGFDGMKALKLAREHNPFIPLIIWTGSISEDAAVECMKAGANNYVIKENLKRLGPAVKHALEERRLWIERRQMEEEFRSIFDNSPVGIFQSTPAGQFLSVNPAMARIYRYSSPQEMLESIHDISQQIYIEPTDRSHFTSLFETQDIVEVYEAKNLRKDGSVFWTSTTARAVRDEAGTILYYEGFLQDITERKLAEEALREGQSKYRNLVETSHDLIWSVDLEGRFTFVNEAARQIYGFEPHELIGRPYFEVLDPEYHKTPGAEEFQERIAQLTEVREAESHVRHRDGRQLILSANSIVLRDAEGKVTGVTGSSRDITERKQTEQALRESEERFRLITQNAEDMIWTMSMDMRLTYVSPSVEKVLGYPAQEILSSPPERFLTAESYAGGLTVFREEVQKARKEPDPNYVRILEMEYIRKDGSVFWVEMKFSFFRDSSGSPTGILGVGRDITARKQAEEKLHESESRLVLALSAAQMSIWEWNTQTNDVLWSLEFHSLAGFADTTSEETFEGYTDLIHPLDVERVRRAAEKALEDNTMFAKEFRIIRPDGEVRWLANLGHVEYGRSHNHLRMIGSVQDVTQRKQAEIERQALLEIMQGLARTESLHQSLELIHRSIGNIIDAENFFVVFHDKNTGLFEEIYSVDQYDPPAPPSRLEKSITSYVFHSGEPLLLTQERFDELIARGDVELVGTDSAAWLGAPLKTSNGILGVIAVQDYENPNRYSERDRDFLASIAAQVALAIERKQAELELQQRNDDLGLINAVNDAVVRGQSLDSIVELLARELNRIFSNRGGAINSTIYMLASDKRTITMQKYFFSPEIAHNIESLIGFSIPPIQIPVKEGGYFHRAMVSRRSSITSDPREIQDWIGEFVETKFLPSLAKPVIRKLVPQIYKTLNIKSTINVPLISEEEVIGFLDVSGPSLFTSGDLKRIEKIGGQLTAVIQRQQANEKMRRSEKFLQSIQNALSASIAILNETGTIVQVNSAWREFGEQNGLAHPEHGVGLNYLEICDSATGPHADEASLTAQAIRAVITGQKTEARIEYPCHSPEVNRWFTLHITKFQDGDHIWVVLAHENITERKLAEMTLVQSQARYQDLFDSSPISLWEEDYSQVKRRIDTLQEGGITDVPKYLADHPDMVLELASLVRVTDVNQASLELYDARQKSDLLRELTAIWHKDVFDQFQKEISGLLGPSRRFSWEGSDRTLTGKPLEVIVNGSIPIGYEKDWSKVIVSVSDITERKQAEETLRIERGKAQKYLDIAGVIMLALDQDGIVTLINQKGSDILGYPADRIIGKNWTNNFLPERIRETLQGVFQNLMSGSTPLIEYYENTILTIHGEERLIAWHNSLVRNSQGEITGTLSSGEDITERKRAEYKLQASEERFRQLADNIEEVFWMTDVQTGSELYMSPASEKVWGYTSEYLLQEPNAFIKSVYPEDLPVVLRNLEREKNGERVEMEYRITRPNGSVRWVWDRAFPIFDENGSVKILAGIAADITERKLAEEALRESENKAKALLNALPDLMFRLDREGKILDYKADIRDLYAQSELSLIRKNIREISPVWFADLIDHYIQRTLESEEMQVFEYQLPIPGRGLLDYEARMVTSGKDEVTAVVRDITERKQAEEALRESEERFGNAFEFAPIGIALVSVEGRWIKVNRSLCDLLGYSPGELAEKTFQEITHPDDLDADLGFVHRVLAGEIASYQMEKRYIHKSGDNVWVLLSVSLVRDSQGQARYFIAQIQDITERKRNEQEISRRAEETSALLATSMALTNLDLNAILHSIGNSAKSLFAADGCRIFLMQPDGESLRCVLALQEDTIAFTDLRIQLGQGVTGAVAASGRAEIVNTMQYDPRAIQVPGTEEEEEAIMFAPLKERERTIGVLSVRRVGAERPFEPADLEFLEAVASMAASAVSNARLFEETQRRLAELEALYENGLAVGQLLEPRQIGERIIETFARHLSWHHVAIRLVRPGTDELELIAFNQPEMDERERSHVEELLKSKINKVGQGMSGWVVQSGQPIRSGRVHEHLHYVQTYEGILSGLYMPLKIGERVIGVISVESEEAEALTAQDERLLATLANQAAIAFENARLYQAAQQEIAERTRIEKELRESQERYRLLVETSLDGVIMLDLDGMIRFSNLQMAGLFNLENPAQILGTNIVSLFAPEEREHIEQSMGNHMFDVPQEGHWLIRKDGSRFFGELRSSALRNEAGEQYAIMAQLRDVTERKQAQEALREERQRFLDLFENSPNPTWLEDFTAVIAWMDELRTHGIQDLKKYLEDNPDEYRVGVSLMRILNVNHAAVIVNGARNKKELIDKVHELMLDESSSHILIHELDMIWRGNTSFGFEMTSRRMNGTFITGIQRVYVPINNNRPDYARVILTSADITERVEMERKLRASELHYRELADSISDVLFELDHELRYTHWNKASEQLMGIPANDAIGRSMYEIFGESEEQVRIGKIYQSVLEEHQPRTFETQITLNSGTYVFEINANLSTRGVSVVARNITERKLSETLMQKRFELVEFSARHAFEKVMQKTIDVASELTGSHIGFILFIGEDQTTITQQAWSTETLNNFRKTEIQSMHYPVEMAGIWAQAIRDRHSTVHNDYKSLVEKKRQPEGHAEIVREMVIPIIRNEKVVAVMSVGNKAQDYTQHDIEIAERFADYAWDITERKQMENALAEERNQLARRVEERTSDLSRANSNLARALRVKDEFLANMSHELRTPLNAILGLSESLGEQVAGPLNEKQQKYLSTINESGHHLLSLINDILDLAKIEAGQITLDINKVDVNSVCQASLRMIKQLAQKKNQEVVFEMDHDLGLMWADERRLKQMIVNLLSNAVKFTPESGRIGLEVRGDRGANKVMITVRDNGIGIKEQDLERLFQPFVQLDSGLAREATGTGLGLALVAQMARLHGGSVHALSQPGEGSRFVIQLPWEPALASDIVARLRNTGKFRAINPNEIRPTILLVEDTHEVVMMLVDYLEMAGYNMITAQDGIDGLEQAKLNHPDLILMDIQMPRMDGFEATQKLRNDPEFKYVPIIALTALAMPNDRQRCLDAGMDEYMSKPVNLKTLAKTIHKLLYQNQEVGSS